MKSLITTIALALVTLSYSQTNDTSNGSSHYQGPIIDMHLHAFTTDNADFFGIPHPPTLRGESFMAVSSPEEQRDSTLAMLKRNNIVLAVVENGQLWEDTYPVRILNGRTDLSIEQLRALHSKGKLDVIAEMAHFYAGITADDESLDPYFALADELGIPIGVHVLPGGPNNGIHVIPQMLGGMRAKNASPLQLEPILIKYPKIKMYIMHGGWPYIEDVKALMYMHSNLYVDIAVLNWVLPKQECYNYIKSLMDAGFGDRIMYGTDQMSWPQVIEIGIETIQSAQFLSKEQKADIFYNNAAEFLGLSEEEIKKHHKR